MKLKIGMKVRVKRFPERPARWNSAGLMDKWMGRIVTIRELSFGFVRIEEDIMDRPSTRDGWSWNTTDFEPVDFKDLDPNYMFLMKKGKSL